MPSPHKSRLDTKLAVRLRSRGHDGFATIANDVATRLARHADGGFPFEYEKLREPVTAHCIEWTREYESVLGPCKERIFSFHLTTDFAIQYLLAARAMPSHDSGNTMFFPHAGWDKPIALRTIELSTMGPILSGLLTQGSISELGLFQTGG